MSTIFDLLKGTAQGDCPSPIIYNICAQILIFKIELDPRIRRIDQNPGGPLPAPIPLPVLLPVPVPDGAQRLEPEMDRDFLFESAMETSKNESFADDSTTCTFLDFNDISALKQILTDFADLSGLKCNFDKTSIMRIGNIEGEIDQQILDLGFQVVDSCTLLGFKFSNQFGLALSNETELINKVTNSFRFWTPFNLSLTGKITVAKSLVLPLFIYYASVINFSPETIATIEKKIENFVCGGLNISKEKIYSAVTEGGLNLFKLHDFALALQCSWVKRTVSLQHDNWRYRLFNISSVGIFNISRCEISGLGPVLKGICENYSDFREQYSTVKNNFLSVPIFDNKNFFYKQGRERMHYDATFFQVQEGSIPETAVLKLKWGDMCNITGNLMAIEDLAVRIGFGMDLEKLRMLAKGYHSARKKYFMEKDPILPVADFFNKFKKGS
jgi:hypothetical protein